LIIVAGLGRRRGGAHGAVRVTSSISQPRSRRPSARGLGRDVGAREQHPVHRVEHLVVRRELVEQAERATAPRSGTSSGLRPKSATRLRGRLSPTQAIFTPGERPGVQAELSNFSHTARTALVEVKTTHW
jgi:hypothetical protein